ncbi:hypothetical protein [uncultured Psychrobacter sp.]|uniref:hypothetical protein n=1 Tax=uncultured Psychrobacter sp. TaxID=259303 RepID=UPI00345A6DF8
MNLNSSLSDTQIAFLDELVELIIEHWRIDEQGYGFYSYHVEKWQEMGYYNDAMLYFWYYEPIEGLNSKQVDNFNGFIKVVNGLGFTFPSTEQALIVSTLKYNARLKSSYTVEDRTEAILDFWQAIDDGYAIDIGNFYAKFNIMRSSHQIIQDGSWDKFDKNGFENSYQDILMKCDMWEAQYPRNKLGIYEQLIYDGESLKIQADGIPYEYKVYKSENSQLNELSVEHGDSTLKKILDWIKGL